MISGVSNGSEMSSSNIKNSSGKLNKIEVVKKGEAGYLPAMDEDNDGVVTMEEFNNYCSENGVSEDEKLKLLSVINSAKQTKKINEEMQAKQKEEKTQENKQENKIIYAKKGDDEYNEIMDENKDDVVTYEEYIRYCQNKKQNEKQQENKVEQAYSNEDTEDTEEITVETEA